MRKYLLLSLLFITTFQTKAQVSTNGLYFDGTGDLVRIPDNPAINFGTAPFTVEAWVRDDDPLGVSNTNYPIISNRTDTGTGGYMLTILDGNLTFFCGAGGAGVATIDFRGGACHHVAVTGPDVNGNFLCYVDGIYSGSGFGSNAGSGDVYIGSSPDFWVPGGFHGLIKEVRLWNTLRTQAQIQTNMNTVLSGAANPNLVGYWRCNDVGSQIITDYSNQQNHGSLGLNPNNPTPSTGCPTCTLPTGSITAGGALTFCTGGSVTLSASTGTGLTYLWKKNGATISGATGSTYAATTSGNYLCVISNSCGSIASNVLTVTVLTTPSIVISASYNSTILCPGGSVYLWSNASAGSTFQWKLNGAAIAGATASSYSATVTGNYTCTASNACFNTTSNTVTITPGFPPPANVTAAGPTTFCNGKSVVLSANTGTNYSYSWRRDGNYISSATAPTYTATQTGNYQVVISIYNSGCTTTSSGIQVTVTPSTTPANVTPPGPIVNCGAGSIVLNANTGTGLTYKWKDFTGSIIPGATSSSYTATTNGSFTVDITNSNGCVSNSAAVLITLASPFAGIGASGGTTFCSGGGVWLSTSWLPIPMTYQWKLNGVPIAGATSVTYYATVGGSYTAVVTNSCGTTTTSPLVVTVLSSVLSTPGTITTTGGAAKVCPGDIRTYSINAVAGATSYGWTPCAGSTIISGQGTNSVTILYNSNFPASDSLRVVAGNGCVSSAQRKIKISRNSPGTPSAITGTNYGVCNLSGIPYSVTNVSGMTYNWSFNTGTATVVSGQGTSAITANYGAGFLSATMSVTAANACGTSTARLKTIYAKPATPAAITGSASVCLNQQDVPYSIAPLSNVTNYTWTGPTGSHVSDGSTTSAGTTLVTTAAAVTVDFATTAGTVKVRGNNTCASGSYKSLAVAIVCREENSSPEFSETRVFPNPATTDFTIETDDPSIPFDLEIYDAIGRLVFSEVNLNSGYRVDANGWADGLYSVVIRKGNHKSTLRLVIQGLE